MTASSTTPATSPARCWASHVAGNTALRIFNPVISSSGTIARAISVSAGERKAMTISETTSRTTLPSRIGMIDRTPSIIPTSVEARDTTWPVSIRSWVAKSSRCRRSYTAVRRS